MRDRNIETPTSTFGSRGRVHVWFFCSCTFLAFERRFNALLGRVITFTRVLTWPTGSIGVLLGGLVIARTRNVGLVYGCVGLLVFLVAFAFWFTPLGHSERYVLEAGAAQDGR